MHTYQVHSPYIPPPEFRKRFAPEPRGYVKTLVEKMEGMNFLEQWGNMFTGLWEHKDKFGPDDAAYLSDLYDGEVAYTDSVLGVLFEQLEAMGWLDRMIVVILSDHGEEFAEHGEYEHDQMYREHLHVPLIIRLPGKELAGTRVKGMASLIDVMPTLLELLDVDGSETRMMGRSLVPAMRSGRTDDLPIIAERVMYADAYQAALRSSSVNLIFRAREGEFEAYDLKKDPGEKNNVAWEAPFFEKTGRQLRESLSGIWAQRAALDHEAKGQATELDLEALEELSKLGYLDKSKGDFTPPEGSPLENWPKTRPPDERR
jgi:arylsulfatase A-like enzyme